MFVYPPIDYAFFSLPQPRLSPDSRTLTADNITSTVGTFSREEPPEFDLDEETQLKVVKSSTATTDFDLPDRVKVLFIKTLEDVDLPGEMLMA